jgi:APA family basic amino acid/polyamine antiporter
MANRLFWRKPYKLFMEEMEGENRLRRILGPISLTSLGVGSTIGAGIFVLVGLAAHDKAGPALILSFVVSGIACVFTALSYAELASMVPVAGSTYTYAYATLGELFAWIIGWDLVLEYAVAASTVANGWSQYVDALLRPVGLRVPEVISKAPFDYDPGLGHIVSTGCYLDLPALLITAAITVILVKGIRESSVFNNIMVGIKVLVILLAIALGAFYINPANWHPFAPYGYTGISFFGHTLFGQTGAGGEPLGMLAGASIIFFSYIGFESVSTHAEEAKNPQKDVPIGLIASLIVCTVLYIGMAVVLSGMVPNGRININAPVADAFRQVGLQWAEIIISIAAIAGITSVLLVTILSQARILLAIARDGLLPQSFFGDVHPRYRTPWKATIATGAFVAVFAALVPLRILAELVSIGTLFAFLIVCLAVLIMRKKSPEAKRPFHCPGMPYVPLLGAAFCLLLMFSLPWENWLRLFIWLIIGFVIYFGYGQRHAKLTREMAQGHLNSRAPAAGPSPTDQP